MLFSADAWPGLADGSITLTFRTWTRAQAKTGGRYRVGGMLLEAVDVSTVSASDISADDARRAGAESLPALLARLGGDPNASVWRIELRYLGADDRIELGARHVDPDDIADIRRRLDRLDHAALTPWTAATLRLIERHPGTVSTVLAAEIGMERPPFKLNVRKLKALGLTQSLDVGYRLTARGAAVVASMTG